MSIKADMLKAADAVLGRLLCLWPRSAPSPGGGDEPRRVLVIRPGGIGDAVLFIPMLEALRQSWPGAELELLLERRNLGVIQPTGLADRIFLYDRFPRDLLALLRRRYDVVIDTEQFHHLSAVVARWTGAPRRIGFGTNRRRRHLTEVVDYSHEVYEVRSFLDLARQATGRLPEWDPEQPFYPVAPEAAAFAEQALEPLKARRIAVIHPGASIPQRRWPPRRYGQLARMLVDDGLGVVILGGPSDGAAAREIHAAVAGAGAIDLAGRCSLAQAAAVVARAQVYISADSGVLHLAYAVGTRTVHLFGPGVHAKWGPPGSRFRTIRTPVPCSPCTRYGYTPPCNQQLACMMGITPRQVYEAVLEQLRGSEEAPV
ncbi:MAG: glycosyltransferase family 9 protein [Acidobacteriota bacterium]|nr:glycosyltransferase family 9 protein [Acidobacteriota bacterium]